MTKQKECFSGQTVDIRILDSDMKTPGSPLRWFLPVLQKGFEVRGKNGSSIREFLCRDIGGDPDYLDQRIQTIFLNGKPVDDVDSTPLYDGVALALSSAMPGVAGAIFRKGGKYAPMRAAFFSRKDDKDSCDEYGYVTLKLFNMVAEELGGFFLEKGIFVKGSDIFDALQGKTEESKSKGMEIRLNGEKITANQLIEDGKRRSRFFLKVLAGPREALTP